MVQYYRCMWTRRSHVLYPLIEAASGPKGRKMLRNDALENSLKELNRAVSYKKLLSYTDWIMPFSFHTGASDKP